MTQERDYLHGFLYYFDIIFAIVLAFYFFTGLYGHHALNPQVFKHKVLEGNIINKAIFFLSFFALALYLYFIPYALWRKSKKPWFSKFCCNINAYVLLALVSFYLIVYWSGNFGYFGKMDTDLQFAISGFFWIFFYFTAAFAFEGAFEIYITHPIIYEIEEEERMRKMEARRKAQQQKNVQQQKPQQHPQPKQSVQMEVKERLRRLKELWDEGLISEEDYKRKKEEILKEL